MFLVKQVARGTYEASCREARETPGLCLREHAGAELRGDVGPIGVHVVHHVNECHSVNFVLKCTAMKISKHPYLDKIKSAHDCARSSGGQVALV